MEKWNNKKSNTPRLQHSISPVGEWETVRYTTDYGNAESNFSLGELTPKHFSFNSHLGACPACHGLGTQLVCDADLMVSDPEKSLSEGAITPWRRGTKPMQAYYRSLQSALVKHFAVDDCIRFRICRDIQEGTLLRDGQRADSNEFWHEWKIAQDSAPFRRLVPQMERLYEETESEFTRNRIRAFMTRVPCQTCHGARLKPEILAVTIKDSEGRELNIHQFSELTIDAAAKYIRRLALNDSNDTSFPTWFGRSTRGCNFSWR